MRITNNVFTCLFKEQMMLIFLKQELNHKTIIDKGNNNKIYENLFIHTYIHIYLSIYLSIFKNLSIYLSIYLSIIFNHNAIFDSVCVCVCVCVCVSWSHRSV